MAGPRGPAEVVKAAAVHGIAQRAVQSVFTVQVDRGLGTGFVGWMDEQSTYVLTAYHVVEGTLSGTVSLERKGGGWQGEIAALESGTTWRSSA